MPIPISSQQLDLALALRSFEPIDIPTRAGSSPPIPLPFTGMLGTAALNPGCGEPSINGSRVAPSELNTARAKYNFRLPCCLCASQDPSADAYTESAVFAVTREGSPLCGQYVAACATYSCGYFLWSFEILYSRSTQPIMSPSARDGGLPPASIQYRPLNAAGRKLLSA
ncbi:hypothetical protein BKA70DRAFT_1442205 [Coprinopsis sp. MPI-PUGE-AT-0042]|nr:hypothetical protein BKA70DRAFT_1442205 [Coprinopsis sp. MPI-PUGE-AT-0042]